MKVKQWIFYIRNREGFSKAVPKLLRHCLEVSIRKIKTNTKCIVKLEEDKEKDVADILTQLSTNKTIDGIALHLPPKEIPAPTGDVDTTVPYWMCENYVSVKLDNSNLSALAGVTNIIDDYVDGRYPWKEFPGSSGKNTMTILIQVKKEDVNNLAALLKNAAGINNVTVGPNKWFRGDKK